METRTSGQVTKASLRLKCTLIQATIHHEHRFKALVCFSRSHVVLRTDITENDDSYPRLQAWFDNEPSVNEVVQAYMVIIQCCTHDDTNSDRRRTNCLEGLLVTSVSAAEHASGKFTLNHAVLSINDSSPITSSSEILSSIHKRRVTVNEELCVPTVKRIGLFRAENNSAITAIIQAHERAAERIITLI